MSRRSGLPRWVSEYRDPRNGKWRLRARRKGSPTHYFKCERAGTDAFWAEYRAWRAGETVTPKPGTRIPCSVSDVVARLYVSTEWLSLKPSTQRQRRNILERFREVAGHLPVTGIHRELVEKWIAKRKPSAGKHFRQVLRMVMQEAIRAGYRSDDPTEGVSLKPLATKGHHSWLDSEIATYQARWPAGTTQGLALGLFLYTGQRRGDIVRMGHQHVDGERIRVVQEKTGEALWIPIHEDLQAVLDAHPRRNLTFLVTEHGAPFASSASFGNWFKKACRGAGLPERCASHGLRKAAARRLAEAGCSTREIMAIGGWKTSKMVDLYTEGVDQERLAMSAMKRISGTKDEQKMATGDVRSQNC